MSLSESASFYFLPSCDVKIPEPRVDLKEVISRWSDANISLPAAVVTPMNEEDVITSIHFAKQNKLRIIPGNGGHGSYVPIDGSTLYLDMNRFDSVSVDKEKNVIIIGGGTTAGVVVRACAKEGYYTLTPNSNAVGMVGAFIGGGSGAWNGIYGFAIDHVLSIRLVTASGSILTLAPGSSNADEAALFNALCGAGHGLGVITSLTMRAWPISALGMTEDKIWARRIGFPPTQIAYAAELFTKLLPSPPRMIPIITFLRIPTPKGTQPVVMVAISYLGPSAEAEIAAGLALEPEMSEHAMSAQTVMVPLEKMNDGNDAFNGHGGVKEFYNCMLSRTDAASIQAAFDSWMRFTQEVEEAQRSFVVIGSWDTKALKQNAAREVSEGRKTYYNGRDRRIFIQATAWYDRGDSGTKKKAEEWGLGEVEVLRRADDGTEFSFVNNTTRRQNLEELYSKDMIEELRETKKKMGRIRAVLEPGCRWMVSTV